MRAGALGVAAIMIAVLGLVGCDAPMGTIAKPGTGGSGAEGAPPAAIDPNAIHPGAALEEDALNGTISGEIADVGSERVIVRDSDGHRFWLTLTPRTVITEDGQP